MNDSHDHAALPLGEGRVPPSDDVETGGTISSSRADVARSRDDAARSGARLPSGGHVPAAANLPRVDHCRIVDDLPATLRDFLDPEGLQRRRGAVAAHLARMPGDPRLLDHTAWALTALNVVGWTLAPTVALAADGIRPVDGWPAALGCEAHDDLGRFDLLVWSRAVRMDGAGWSESVEKLEGVGKLGGLEKSEGAERPEDVDRRQDADPAVSLVDPVPALVDLAVLLGDCLERAGCPRVQGRSAIASSLGTLARQEDADGARIELAQRLWRALEPRATSGPGEAGFRRPACCGLMPLARTDALCCPDCPHR